MGQREIIELMRLGAEAFNGYRSNNPGLRINLKEMQLQGMNFKGFNFSRVDLSRADLSGAILDGADLTDTLIVRTKFVEASLVNARLTRVNNLAWPLPTFTIDSPPLDTRLQRLIRRAFTEAIEKGRSVSEFVVAAGMRKLIRLAKDPKGNMRRSKKTQRQVVDEVIEKIRATLTPATVVEMKRLTSLFEGPEISDTGVDFYGARLSGAFLDEAVLSGASFARADCTNAHFMSSSLAGCNFMQAKLNGVNLFGADLRGANVQSAGLTGVTLAGARIDGLTTETWLM